MKKQTQRSPKHTPTPETPNEMQQHLESVLYGRTKPAFANDEIPKILRAVNSHESLLKENIQLMIDKEKLLEAAKAQHEAVDILFAMLVVRDPNFVPSESRIPWKAMVKGNRAIAQAEGKVTP